MFVKMSNKLVIYPFSEIVLIIVKANDYDLELGNKLAK